MSSLVFFLSHLLPPCPSHDFPHRSTFCCFAAGLTLYKSTGRLQQTRFYLSTIGPSSYTPPLPLNRAHCRVCDNVLPTKPGQDREPNLLGLLGKIRLTVFDLAGVLWGMEEGGEGREGRGEESFSVLEQLREGKALIG